MLTKLLESLGGLPPSKFRPVQPCKLPEPVGPVPVPRTELRTGRNLLQPAIVTQVLLSNAPRPQTVDQYAEAIRPMRILVHPLHGNPHRRLTSRGRASFMGRQHGRRTPPLPSGGPALRTLKSKMTQGVHNLLRRKEGMAAPREGTPGSTVPVHDEDQRDLPCGTQKTLSGPCIRVHEGGHIE